MKIGQFILFDLDVWENDQHKIIELKSEILSICYDPLKLHEPKCSVNFNNEDYGIPFSEIKEVFPAINEQLVLF